MKLTLNLDLDEKQQDELFDAFKRILWKSINKMNEIAVKQVPVDTGRLKNSIRIEPFIPNQNKYYLLTPVHYASHVEFGTIKQKAQPFFRPALHEVANVHLRKYVNEEIN